MTEYTAIRESAVNFVGHRRRLIRNRRERRQQRSRNSLPARSALRLQLARTEAGRFTGQRV